jgi:hypothetical protein
VDPDEDEHEAAADLQPLADHDPADHGPALGALRALARGSGPGGWSSWGAFSLSSGGLFGWGGEGAGSGLLDGSCGPPSGPRWPGPGSSLELDMDSPLFSPQQHQQQQQLGAAGWDGAPPASVPFGGAPATGEPLLWGRGALRSGGGTGAVLLGAVRGSGGGRVGSRDSRMTPTELLEGCAAAADMRARSSPALGMGGMGLFVADGARNGRARSRLGPRAGARGPEPPGASAGGGTGEGWGELAAPPEGWGELAAPPVSDSPPPRRGPGPRPLLGGVAPGSGADFLRGLMDFDGAALGATDRAAGPADSHRRALV